MRDIGIVNLHPSKGTHWVCYINDNYLDSYGCVCPKKLSKFFKKRTGCFLYSEYQVQKNDSFCASPCLYINYLTKVLGIAFKSAERKISVSGNGKVSVHGDNMISAIGDDNYSVNG